MKMAVCRISLIDMSIRSTDLFTKSPDPLDISFRCPRISEDLGADTQTHIIYRIQHAKEGPMSQMFPSPHLMFYGTKDKGAGMAYHAPFFE